MRCLAMIGGLIWVVIRHRGRFKGLTVKGMILMAVLSLYYGFSTIGIDNWCHVGGILTGFLAAMILYHKKWKIVDYKNKTLYTENSIW